ncbi:MAG: hypothetical protein VX438_01250 [Planctomycetota bacterium]|nr:hypothetical protein [Planctomycetota bacterium]
MRSTRRKTAGLSPELGQDSFLDVVANLIGILIILVMLIGTQAKMVWQEIRSQKEIADVEAQELDSATSTANRSIARLKSENSEIEQAIADQKQAVVAARQGRDRVQLEIEAMKTAIGQKQKTLSQSEQKSRKLASATERLRQELDSIENEFKQMELVSPKTSVIEHLPTPIAKTVFGEEVHFRLQGGRIAAVPLNELFTAMRSEWRVKAKKLAQTASTVETVGPVGDFRLQYKLILKERVQATDHGKVRSLVPGLERFILLPTRENLGEKFEQALREESQFLTQINSLDPKDVSISIWVYPDSFGQFNELKRLLYERGFLCAGWPLPENQPISGSPNGFRTAAQ